MNARPTDRLAIAVAQLNPIVGDIAGNADKARTARAQAAREGADLVALPELFLCGYAPEDLVLKPALQAACRAKVEELARESSDGGPALLIGTPWLDDGKLYNAYCLLDRGAIAAVRLKVNLPNYGVFDERRVFAPGPPPGPVNFRGVRIGLPICEDIWTEWGDYEDVVEYLAETGTELMIVPNGSPYSRDKDEVRLNIAVARVTESDVPFVYVNQIGGQDELVFDGASFGLHADRSLVFQLPAFREAISTLVWERTGNGWRCSGGPFAALEEGDKADYLACMLGLRDYVNKNGFKGVVLGLSGGGIDSALVAALAVDALGPERMRCVMLPYRFTSQASLDDAAAVARALGVRYDVAARSSASPAARCPTTGRRKVTGMGAGRALQPCWGSAPGSGRWTRGIGRRRRPRRGSSRRSSRSAPVTWSFSTTASSPRRTRLRATARRPSRPSGRCWTSRRLAACARSAWRRLELRARRARGGRVRDRRCRRRDHRQVGSPRGAWLLFARFVPQIQVLVVSVVAAHYLGPDLMGRQSFISFVVSSVVILATAGLPGVSTASSPSCRGRASAGSPARCSGGPGGSRR